MALHWVPEVSMSKEEMDYFLAGRLIGRLSTIGKDGYPYVNPIWFYWDGESILCDLGKNRLAYRNLRRNPKCSFIVDIDERPIHGVRANMARGVLLVGDGVLYDRTEAEVEVGRHMMKVSDALSLIDPKYLPECDKQQGSLQKIISQASPNFYPLLQGESERVLLFIKPRTIRAWDFSKAPFNG